MAGRWLCQFGFGRVLSVLPLTPELFRLKDSGAFWPSHSTNQCYYVMHVLE